MTEQTKPLDILAAKTPEEAEAMLEAIGNDHAEVMAEVEKAKAEAEEGEQ